jgi:hypothetical protein
LQPRPHHLGVAVLGQDLAVERCQQVQVREAQVSTGDFFVDHTCRQAAQPQAAILLGQFGADETEFTHFAQQHAVQIAGLVALQKAGFDALFGKSAGRFGQGLQVFVDVGVRVHHGSPA